MSPCLAMPEPRHHKARAKPTFDDPERSTKPRLRQSLGRLLLQPVAATFHSRDVERPLSRHHHDNDAIVVTVSDRR
jgi:hypothetical protein